MRWVSIIAAVAMLAGLSMNAAARAGSTAAGPSALNVTGLKIGMSPAQVAATLRAYNASIHIREIRVEAPSGEPVVRIIDAVVGGIVPGASAQQDIILFTLQPPARAYEIVEGTTLGRHEQRTLAEHLDKMRAALGEPSRSGDVGSRFGPPGTRTYAWVFDGSGGKLDADTQEGQALFTLCGEHGLFGGPQNYVTATELVGQQETNVSDRLRVAVSYSAACGLTYRRGFLVTPEGRVSQSFQDLTSDPMALADKAWERQEKQRLRKHLPQAVQAAAQPPTPAAVPPPAVPPRRPEAPRTAPGESAMQLAARLDRAIRHEQEAATAGDALAALDLADMYDQGKAVPEDPIAALAWYRRAAALGNASAMFHVGLSYDVGRGIPADHVAAARWYERAAALHHGRAEYNLAQLYARGSGIPRDPARAAALLRAAAADGIAVSPAAGPAIPAVRTEIHVAPTPAGPIPTAAAQQDGRVAYPTSARSCGDILMSEQMEEEISNADRISLRRCQITR